MTPTASSRLTALMEGATPGPWRHTRTVRRNDGSGFTAAIFAGAPGHEVIGATDLYGGLWLTEDAALIVALVNALPALVELVAAAEASMDGVWSADPFGAKRDKDLSAALAALNAALAPK